MNFHVYIFTQNNLSAWDMFCFRPIKYATLKTIGGKTGTTFPNRILWCNFFLSRRTWSHQEASPPFFLLERSKSRDWPISDFLRFYGKAPGSDTKMLNRLMSWIVSCCFIHESLHLRRISRAQRVESRSVVRFWSKVQSTTTLGDGFYWFNTGTAVTNTSRLI